MSDRSERLRMLLFLGVAASAVGLSVVAYGLGFLNSFERQTVDARFSIRGDRGAPKDVVVVKVDDVTFSALQTQWPFPRSLHAKLLDRIRAAKPSAIAFDVQFTEPTTPAQDNALIEAVARNRGKIVLATTEVDARGQPNVFGGGGILEELGARAGNSNFPTDRDGVIRRFAHTVEGLESFAVVAAEIALGRPLTAKDMGGGAQWIDYAGPPGTVNSVSYSLVLQGRVEPSVFRDKVVVIGATAPSLQDIHDASTGALMPGPEIQANAIQTALDGFPLRSSASWLNVLLVVLAGVIAPLVSLRFSVAITIASSLLAGTLFVVGTQVAFEHGWVSSFTYPLGALVLSTVGSLGTHYVVAAFEKERVRDVFSRFVPEQVVDQVLASADADLRLGGKEVVSTIMFSDLRGFTSSAEEMPAEKVIHVLNHYLHEMSEAILAHGGTLVCYMGDGIMAVFGAPIEQEDHADRALAAAREMLTERLPKFNAWMEEQGLGKGYHMGIGLNSGPVMTGNVGHARRMDYTAVGDVTNTASRIEGMTKGTPFSIFLAESTVELLGETPGDLVYYDEMEVRGRQAKLKIWALDIRKDEGAPDLAAARAKAEPVQASA